MSLTESAKKLNQGDGAPDFSLPGVDGNTHTLRDVAGAEGTLIVFMCNHCPFVIHVREELARLGRDYIAKRIW